MLACFLLGRKLVGDRAAWIGGLLLALSSGFVLAGRFLLMDSLLTCCTCVGMLAALIALQSKSRETAWWLVAGIAWGLGVMTKGPVAPVLCFPPLVMLAWLTKNPSMFRPRNVLAVVVPIVAIAGPWFWQVAASQEEFVGYFFWKHNFQRFVNGFNHVQPWWFYLPVLALGMLPGTFFVPALAVYLGRKNDAACRQRTQPLGALLLSALWVVGFFSLSSCKLPTYILPAFPLLALVLGKVLADCTWNAERWTAPAHALVESYCTRGAWQLLLGTSVMAAVLVVAHGVLNPAGLGLTLLFALVPAAGCALLVKKQLAAEGRLPTVAAGLCTLVTLFAFGCVVPEFANWRSVSQSAASLQTELGGSTPIVFFDQTPDAAALAIPHAVVQFDGDQPHAFKAFLAEHQEAVVVGNRATLVKLAQFCGNEVEFSAARRGIESAWRRRSRKNWPQNSRAKRLTSSNRC